MSKRKRASNKTAFTGLSLKEIYPKTDAQQDVFDAYSEGYHLFLHGIAGTGKSFIALYLALRDLVNSNTYDKIIIIRSAVSSRDLGYLPGDKDEKTSVYETPYVEMFSEFFGLPTSYEMLKEKEKVIFRSTSFLRGVTFHNAIVIVDEIQNFNFHEADTVITRLGDNCKIIFCGDIQQNDLIRSKYDVSGLSDFMNILSYLEEFEFIEFHAEDIVRNDLVKKYILAKQKIND